MANVYGTSHWQIDKTDGASDDADIICVDAAAAQPPPSGSPG